MDSKITGLTASPGDNYGTIKIEWDIPEDWFSGGIEIVPDGVPEGFTPGVHSFNHLSNNWNSQLSNLPNINLAGLQEYDPNVSQYRIKASLFGMANPAWGRTNPETISANNNPNMSVGWVGNSVNATQQYTEFHQYVDMPMPLTFIPTSIVSSLLQSETDGTGGVHLLNAAPDETNIPTPSQQMNIADNIDSWYSSGYTPISGLHWVATGEGERKGYYKWTIHSSQNINNFPPGTTYYPEGTLWGAGSYGFGPSQSIYLNEVFNPNYGEEIDTPIYHRIMDGAFVIIGRRHSPTNSIYGDGMPIIVNGVEHPSESQMKDFIDTSIDPENMFSFIYHPNDNDWSNQRCSVEKSVDDGNWYFTILYTTGCTLYPTTANNDAGPSDSWSLNQGFCPEYDFTHGTSPVIHGPCGSVNGIELFKNFVMSENDHNLREAQAHIHLLDENRQGEVFRSELNCSVHRRVELPFKDFYMENSDPLAIIQLTHFPTFHNLNYEDIHKVKFESYGTGTGFAVGAANYDESLFQFNMSMHPYVNRVWDNSYHNQWIRDRNKGENMWDSIKDFHEQPDYTDVEYELYHPNNVFPFQIIYNGWSSAQIEFGGILANMLFKGQQVTVGGNSNDYNWGNWGDYPAIPAAIPYGDPDDIDNQEVRLSPLYLRLDNELWFCLDQMNVPDNFIIRFLNNTLSGEYEAGGESNRPVWYDFTKSDLLEAPYWDFQGTHTINQEVNSADHLAHRYLRLRLPIDTTFEPDGMQNYDIIAGLIDPNAPVNEGTNACTIKGGSYGMPLILTNDYSPYINQSIRSDNIEVQSFLLHFQNTPPEISLNEIPSAHDEQIGERFLTGYINSHSVPCNHSNQFLTNPNTYWEPVNGEVTLGHTEWSLHDNAKVISENNNAIGSVIDLAGNFSSEVTNWSLYWTGPEWIAAYGSYGNYNVKHVFGDTINIQDLGNVNTPWNQSQLNDGDNYYIFSSDAVMCMFAGVNSDNPLEANIRGYTSLESQFNQVYRHKEYLDMILASEEVWNTHHQLVYNNLKNMIHTGFRVIGINGLIPMNEDDTGPAMVLLFQIPVYSYSGNQEIVSYKNIYGDKALENNGPAKLLVDKGCISTGKFATFPVLKLPSFGHNQGPDTNHKVTYAWSTSAPALLSAATYHTAFNGAYCDINPNYNWDSGGTPPGPPPEPAYGRTVYWYSPLLQRWDTEEGPVYQSTEDDTVQDKSVSVFTGKKGEMFSQLENISPNGTPEFPFYVNEGKDSYKSFEWVSKKLNMRAVSQQKMFYKVRVVTLDNNGPVSCFIRTDNMTEYVSIGLTTEISNDFKIPKEYKRGRWLQIKLTTDGKQEEDNPRLSSVTVIWRQKAIK